MFTYIYNALDFHLWLFTCRWLCSICRLFFAPGLRDSRTFWRCCLEASKLISAASFRWPSRSWGCVNGHGPPGRMWRCCRLGGSGQALEYPPLYYFCIMLYICICILSCIARKCVIRDKARNARVYVHLKVPCVNFNDSRKLTVIHVLDHGGSLLGGSRNCKRGNFSNYRRITQ